MNKKKIIIVAIILVIAITVYYYWKKQKAVIALGSEKESLGTGFNIQAADTRNDNFPLNDNSKGARVETLQRAINRQIEKQNAAFNITPPDSVLSIDSVFGPKTKAALLKVAGVAYYSGTGMTETQFNSFIELSNK